MPAMSDLSDIKAAPAVKTGERIARHIADRVSAGSLLPGDQLPSEVELINQLGVSRGSLREGLRLLEATGVIVVRNGRNGGAWITHAGATAFATTSTLYLQLAGATYGELLDARLMIEPGLTDHAARKCSDDDVTRLRAHLDAAGSPDCDHARQHVPSVVRFHEDLLRISGNRALALYVGAMMSVWARRLAQLIATSGSLEIAHRNLRDMAHVLEAVEDRDGPLASQAMRDCLGDLRTGVEAAHPQLFDEPVLWGGPRPGETTR
jgi:DNA-binding FadR family transcriptional regulator